MRPADKERAAKLEDKLVYFDQKIRALPGLKISKSRTVFVEQIIDSLRRIEFASFIRDHDVSAERANPATQIFDPLRAAVFNLRNGRSDEAFWLTFLFVHFGKHPKDGWRLVRDVYGSLGGTPWTWERVSSAPDAFATWLASEETRLKADGISRRFGNHRKYESLSAASVNGTAAVVRSYVDWVSPPRTHQQLIVESHKQVGQDPTAVFDMLYRSMNSVKRFGRLAKFDYLTMLGKLGIAPIEPGSAYLYESTGPLRGAKLLFFGSVNADASSENLDTLLANLDKELKVGMQVLEDATCNWQKSPSKYVYFRG